MCKQTSRKNKGQSIIVLGLLISVSVILLIGMYSFEINRMEMAREQLRAAADAASLAGAATLASSNNTDPTTAQTQSEDTALTTFQQNSVLGVSLANATMAATNNDTPSANQGSLFVQFLNPNNNDQPVSLGDPTGKIVSVTGAFTEQPAFAKFLGISGLPIHASSMGGVPSMDVVLCFDVSASIDDQTPVTFVRRTWSSTQNKVLDTIASTTSGSPVGALAEGTIFNIIGPPAIGSSVDGLYPQNLDDSNTSGKNSYPMNFSEVPGRTGSAVGLRGTPNQGSKPGNYGHSTMSTGNAQTYTDLVVNIDGNTTFGGLSAGGFNFPDVATLVEAARGNLENTTVFASSGANTVVPSNVIPTVGYQAEYLALAHSNMHPIYDAQQAAQTFLDIMNTNTDAHFSLVEFTSNAGTSATSTYNAYNVDEYYTNAGSGNFPVELIALSPTVGNTNYTTCYNALPNTVAISGTNIGDAVYQAVLQLRSHSRTGSKKAIILFTDGEPTSAGPLDNSDPLNNARLAAIQANASGIPVYCIGLAQNQAIIPSETAILNATDANHTSGGIAAIAGYGGQFFLVTNVADLQLTFENIARQLVQLVK